MTVRFIWKKSCDTCRKYKKQLDAWGVAYEGREINAEPLSPAEVRALIGDRPVKPFLNSHNAEYRARNLKAVDLDAEAAAALIGAHNNLLRRPVLIVDGTYVIGNDLPAAAALLGKAAP
ncbi:MAG: ArsC family reductase [Myxococcales bacterium]|nr:ArsC family reductase [Myxococcales bacterium]